MHVRGVVILGGVETSGACEGWVILGGVETMQWCM